MTLKFLSAIIILSFLVINISKAHCQSSDSPNLKRPNILFVFGDDWGRYASIYSKFENKKTVNSIISTPTMDRMAKEGAIYTNAFVPSPSCTPCRSAVLSGRYFWQTRLGAILQGAVWDDNIPTFPKILEKTGYHTGNTYKVWGPGVYQPQTFGIEYNSAGQKFNSFSEEVTKNIKTGMTINESKIPLYNEVRQNFCDFLNSRKKGAPFLYWWGPTNTHRTWEKGSGNILWGIEPNKIKGIMPQFIPDVDSVREDFADYLGECMALDHGISVLVDVLEKIGELDNTLIVLSGDHGIPGFPRAKSNLYDIGCGVSLIVRYPKLIQAGTVINDITNIMDLAPTFLEVAQCEPEISMAGRSLWGRLKGETENINEKWVIMGRERHIATARAENLPYPQRALRTKNFLYIVNFAPDRWPMGDPPDWNNLNLTTKLLETNTRSIYPDMDAGPTKAWMILHRDADPYKDLFDLAFSKRPQEELYNISDDPDQMKNLASNPEYNSIKEQLKEHLFCELKKQRDPRICDKEIRYEKSPYTDVFEHNEQKAREKSSERLRKSGSE